MKKIDIGKSGLKASEIVLGCMRIDKMSVEELSKYVDTAIAEGSTLFDHSDIYGKGYCEEFFWENRVYSKNSKSIKVSKSS